MSEASKTLAPEARPVQSAERRVARICEQCGGEFQALVRKVRAGGGRFCSPSCMFRNTWATGRNRKLLSLDERFWRFVDRSGGPDACWPWLGSVKRGDGYGSFKLKDGTQVPAHRFAYEITTGRSLGPLLGRHSCDRKCCVNPRHIEPGTHAQNSGDMVARGRQAAGRANGRAKLTEADVLAIRASPETLKALARQYGLGMTTVAHIRSGRTWKHVAFNPDDAGVAQAARSNPFASKLTADAVREILTATGQSIAAIAERHGVSKTAIENVRARKTWKHVE